jgi:hypothetical protein
MPESIPVPFDTDKGLFADELFLKQVSMRRPTKIDRIQLTRMRDGPSPWHPWGECSDSGMIPNSRDRTQQVQC